VVHSSGGSRFQLNAIPQIAVLGDGRLMTVWAAGNAGGRSMRVVASFSADDAHTWSAPRILIDDPEKVDTDPNILVDGRRVFVYCTRVNIPNRIDKSWTYMTRSEDNGATWSAPLEIAIPRQYISGKQHNAIKLDNGSYAMGIAWDLWAEEGMAARTEGEMNLSTGVLLSNDGVHWTLHGDLHATVEKVTPGAINGLCEPALVQLANGEIFMLLRSGGSHPYVSRSDDEGVTWSEPKPSTLVGHNTPTALLRLRKHSDEILTVWDNSPLVRWPLTAAISADGGKSWSTPRVIAPGDGYQVSYPGVTQLPDGTFVAVWQQQLPSGGRDIRWARFSREWVLGTTR